MRHLKSVSYIITGLGVVAVAAELLLNLSATMLLVGLMLIVAGVVKVTMVALWHTVAGFGAPVIEEVANVSSLPTSSEHRKARK